MRLERISITNVLGARAVDVHTTAPVQIFCGQNGAGKSSVRDAVALALTGELSRITARKKLEASLITAGADLASVTVVDGDGEVHSASINAAGKLTASGTLVGPTINLLLDAQRFAQLDATTRRAFLLELMNVQTDGPAIAQRLLARGLDAARIEQVKPLLRAGFDSAAKEAASRATQAKGAWRATTGEAWGSQKAKGWKADKPAVDAAAAQALAAELQRLDEAIAAYQRDIGRMEGEEQRRQELSKKLGELQGLSERLERIKKKAAFEAGELQRLTAELETVRAAAGGGPREGLVHDLAFAISEILAVWPRSEDPDQETVRETGIAALTIYERQHGPVSADAGGAGDPVAAARIPALEEAIRITTRAVENDKRDLETAQRATGEIDAIRAELAKPFDGSVLEATRNTLKLRQGERAEVIKRQDALKAQQAAAAQAEKRTADAAGHAADVAAWDALADALGPDGIPAELLGEAMGPLNERLAQAAEDSGWARVMVSLDMEIVVAADSACSTWRPRRLLSESEQWRCDAMLAEAIGYVSGARLLVLDRFDVLDLRGRGELLQWLDVLADNEEMDTALVFGTLKALPTGLPHSTQAHWIENGVAGQLAEAA